MSEYEKVGETTNLLRDTESSALVSTDYEGLRAYKEKKKRSRQLDDTINDVEQLKSDVGEIKSLLHQLINSNNTSNNKD